MSGEAPAPSLSVVVAIVSDTTKERATTDLLVPCLDALQAQAKPGEIEIIVPYVPPLEGIEALRDRFAGARFLAVDDLPAPPRKGSREHHDLLRARGLAVARGAIVALLEDHARPAPDWCARMVAAHAEDHAAIGGAIENGIDRPLNWAVYFCDFGRYQNPLPAGESATASDANVSYKRDRLEAIRPVWRETFREPLVNGALHARGETIALSPDVVVYQQRSDLTFGAALQERYVWGRSYAATRRHSLPGGRRLVYAALSPLLPPLLTLRMARNAMRKERPAGAFLRALPFLVPLTLAWSLGEMVGYLMPSSRLEAI
jgi:hypothetical protein